jgi:AAA15 family ATPase/GTPase
MLESLRLINFKGFENHLVEFGNFSVVIGHNNAGKSSLFEAVRITDQCENHLALFFLSFE